MLDQPVSLTMPSNRSDNENMNPILQLDKTCIFTRISGD